MFGLVAFLLGVKQAPHWNVSERVLCTLPGRLVGDLAIGPKGRHVLCAVTDSPPKATEGKWSVYDNGKLIGRYDDDLPVVIIPDSAIPGLDVHFSQEGRHYGFIGHRNGRDVVNVDSIEDEPCQEVSHFAFSPEGRHWAYRYQGGGVWDGKRLAVSQGPWRFTFSPDGKHLAWVADNGLFLDGKDFSNWAKTPGPYHEIQSLAFSPDGKHFAYVEEIGGQTSVIRDSTTIHVYQERSGGVVHGLQFSPDSQQLAYFAGAQDYQLVVYGGGKLREEKAEGSMPDTIHWSKDGKHIAYLTSSLGPFTKFVEDGVASQRFGGAFTTPEWMLDDGTLAYCSSDLPNFSSVDTHIGSRVIRGRQLLAITPDETNVMLTNKNIYEPMHQIWINDQLVAERNSEMVMGRFSGPRALHTLISFTTMHGETDYYLDGRDIGVQSQILFCPDEQHVAVLGKTVLVDGQSVLGSDCDHIHFVFTGDSRFALYALRGPNLIEVTGKLAN